MTEELTNEVLSSLFNDNFQLAYCTIQLARNEVKTGQETSMQKILKEIKKNPHLHVFEDHVLDEEHKDTPNQ